MLCSKRLKVLLLSRSLKRRLRLLSVLLHPPLEALLFLSATSECFLGFLGLSALPPCFHRLLPWSSSWRRVPSTHMHLRPLLSFHINHSTPAAAFGASHSAFHALECSLSFLCSFFSLYLFYFSRVLNYARKNLHKILEVNAFRKEAAACDSNGKWLCHEGSWASLKWT